GTLKSKNPGLTASFIGQFFIKRVFRLYPAYLFAIAVIIFLPITVSLFRPIQAYFPTWQVILVNLLFLYNYSCCMLTPAFWSLGVEVQLYLLYPLFLWIKNFISFPRVLISTLLLSLSCFFLFDWLEVSGLKLGFVGCSLFDWLLGVYLAERFYMGLPPVLNKKYMLPMLGFVFIGFLIYRPTLDLASTTASIISFFIIQQLIYSNNSHGIISRVWGQIGKSSYSIYLLHMPLIPYLFAVYHKIIPINPFGDMFVGIPFTFAMMYLIGLAMFRYIESPMIQWGKKFTQGKTG
ncbi:MAG: acyltransferase, partial [Cytophagales bacterium]|nr:acyltransferase [Cytophagales bacterium]